MTETTLKTFRKLFNKLLHSISFIPALFGCGFLALAILFVELDARGWGVELNARIKWLTLKDASTAQTIVATAGAGMISLTVFSFSMVMVVLSQAASQMSNRMLDDLVADRVQKIVLGLFIGTIIYSLFLLTTISEATEGQNIPTLSIYVLIVLTIIDIFLFVYFLHYVVQSFRYEQLIQRIHNRSMHSLDQQPQRNPLEKDLPPAGEEIAAWESGYFQQYNTDRLIALAQKENMIIHFLYPTGTYFLKGAPFMRITATTGPEESVLKRIAGDIDFYFGQEISKNPYYGFQHLMEVSVKALSPAINDPGTAVISLNCLSNLLAHTMQSNPERIFHDNAGYPRLVVQQRSFEELFRSSVLPVWDYGKNDRLVQGALLRMLEQLEYIDKEKRYSILFNALRQEAIQLSTRL